MRRAETYWVLTRAQVSAGRNDDAIATMRRALASTGLPVGWRARMLAWLAMLERAATGDLDAADATAIQALTAAEKAGDRFATAHALTGLWLTRSVRRDHVAALDYIDRALRVVGDDPGHADLRSFALGDRIFTLQNLDRWPEAELALRQAREVAQRSGNPDRGTWAAAAVLRYWLGRGTTHWPSQARVASGWEAFTLTEVKIAALLARGDSTSDTARGMFLSRRTVQTYISRILAKLGGQGRVDIVREALRQGVSP